MRTYAIVSFTGIGLAVGLWILARDPAAPLRPPRPTGAPEQSAGAGSAKESRKLQTETEALRRAVRATTTVPDQKPEEPAEDDAPPPPDHNEEVRRSVEQVNAVSADLGAHIRSEVVDTRWARTTESEVREALRAEAFQGVEATKVLCASSMCEVKLRSQLSGPALEETLAHLTSTGPFRHGGFVNYGTDDGTIAMYIARAGHRLPPPPR